MSRVLQDGRVDAEDALDDLRGDDPGDYATAAYRLPVGVVLRLWGLGVEFPVSGDETTRREGGAA